jgi:hypothetical protein
LLAQVRAVQSDGLKPLCLLFLGLGDHSAALLAGTVDVWDAGKLLGQVGMTDVDSAAIATGVRDNEFPSSDTGTFGLDLTHGKRTKAALAIAAGEVSRIDPFASRHRFSLHLTFPE